MEKRARGAAEVERRQFGVEAARELGRPVELLTLYPRRQRVDELRPGSDRTLGRCRETGHAGIAEDAVEGLGPVAPCRAQDRSPARGARGRRVLVGLVRLVEGLEGVDLNALLA